MKNINEMTSKELKEVAKELKVKNWWTLKKAELIAAIEAAQNVEETSEDYTIVAENSNGGITIIAECHHEDITQDAQDEPEEAEEVAAEESIVEAKEAVQNESVKNNGWEEIAKKNIAGAYNWIVGENENTLQDYGEDSDDYKASYNYLYSGSEIMHDIYRSAITNKYDDGYCGDKAPKEMRFAGKKFCMNLIRELLKKDGYLKDEEKPNKKQDLIEYNGKTQNLSQWAKELDMPGQTLFARIHLSGWTVEKAFTTPVKRRKKKIEEEA